MRKGKAKRAVKEYRRVFQYRLCRRPGFVVELVLERKFEPRLAGCRE